MTLDLMTWVALRIDEDESVDEAVGLHVLAAVGGPQSLEDHLAGGAPGVEPGEEDVRSLLACLEDARAGESSVVEWAELAGMGLSNAFRPHAFDRSSTAAEARHLLHLARELVLEVGA